VFNVPSTWFKSGWFTELDNKQPEDYLWTVILMVNQAREQLPTVDDDKQARAVARAMRTLSKLATEYADQLNPPNVFDED